MFNLQKWDSSTHRWSGSQQSQVIHLVCPVKVFPICVPVTGSHRQIYTDRTTQDKYITFMDDIVKIQIRHVCVWSLPDCSCTLKPASCHQVTRRCSAPSVCVLKWSRIQLSGVKKLLISSLCLDAWKLMLHYWSDFIPLAVWWGVSVVKSQKRTVVSPEPLARYLKQTQQDVFRTKSTVSPLEYWLCLRDASEHKNIYNTKIGRCPVTHLPVGLKAVEMTASVCPWSVLVQRATARTLNTAWGWYTTGRTCSVSTPRAFTHNPRLDTTSASPCTKNASGTGSSYRG